MQHQMHQNVDEEEGKRAEEEEKDDCNTSDAEPSSPALTKWSPHRLESNGTNEILAASAVRRETDEDGGSRRGELSQQKR